MMKDKKHASEPKLRRQSPNRDPKRIIGIVTEGKTELLYFQRLVEEFELRKNPRVEIQITSINTGASKTLLQEARKKKKECDDVWIVCDKDENSDDVFSQMLAQARSQKIQVAYSNQAFEYWVLLHFSDLQGEAIDRRDYEKKLNQVLRPYNIAYTTTPKTLSPELLDVLMDSKLIDQAISRAKRIHEKKITEGKPYSESCTTVYCLIGMLKDISSVKSI